jgi:hypothetical protein
MAAHNTETMMQRIVAVEQRVIAAEQRAIAAEERAAVVEAKAAAELRAAVAETKADATEKNAKAAREELATVKEQLARMTEDRDAHKRSLANWQRGSNERDERIEQQRKLIIDYEARILGLEAAITEIDHMSIAETAAMGG